MDTRKFKMTHVLCVTFLLGSAGLVAADEVYIKHEVFIKRAKSLLS